MNQRFRFITFALLLVAVVACNSKPNDNSALKNAAPVTPAAPATPAPATPPAQGGEPETATMEVNKAVMVTEELDLGKPVPSIPQGLAQIERRYRPDDGVGRTFAVLDAYGEPTPDGKLHISMHVSSEKPGLAELVFKPTGRVLWRARIMPSSEGGKQKNLTIMIDDGTGTGKTFLVDGSKNPPSVLDAGINGRPQLVKDVWPDGAEREVTFVYSACGCPVKAMVRRVGDRTVRTKDLPVLFPDDPQAVAVISHLMRWQ
ncbi:MAG TPA: hypothetical protein VJ464_16585 [Blastocatellia bacterium]|nr:hypothetical protein [Blastocatellia bacterium]